MVKLTNDPNPTSDPNYLGMSRTPSQNDVPTDTSLGKVFGNLGETFEAGISGVDQFIKDKLTKRTMSGMEDIFDKAGGNLPPEEIPAIAGTGYRKQGGISGVSGTGEGGDITSEPTRLPATLEGRVDGLRKMYAAYKQGYLSATYVDSQVNALEKKIMAEFPGYEEEAMKKVAEIKGMSTANEVRKQILQDMNAMMNEAASGQNRIIRLYESNKKYLDPGTTPEMFAADPNKYLAVSQERQAYEQRVISGQHTLTWKKGMGESVAHDAEKEFVRAGDQYIAKNFAAAIQEAQLNLARFTAQGLGADSKEVVDETAKLQYLQVQIENGLRGIAKQKFQNSGDTYETLINNPENLEKRITQLKAPLMAVAHGYGQKDMGIVHSAANIAAMQTNSDFVKFTQKYPAIRAYPVFSKISPQMATQVLSLSGGAGLSDMTKAVLDTGWMNVANTNNPPPAASDIINGAAAAAGKNNPGGVSKIALEGIRRMTLDPDPKVAANAVQSIYGDDKLFARVATPEQQRQMYLILTTPAYSQKMIQFGKSGPEGVKAFQQYSDFVERYAPGIAKQAITDLQSAVSFKQYDVTFNDWKFTATSKPGYVGRNGLVKDDDTAQRYVTDVNTIGAALRPVLEEKYGKEGAIQKYQEILGRGGYNPPRNPDQGTWLEGLSKSMVLKNSEGKTIVDQIHDFATRPQHYQSVDEAPGLKDWLSNPGGESSGKKPAKKSSALGDEVVSVDYGPIEVTRKDGSKFTVEGTPENIQRFFGKK